MSDQEWDRIVGVVARETGDAVAQDVPQRLCDAVLKLLPVSGASVSLRGEGMPVPLGASGESAAYVLEMEVTLGDGPGLEAAETGAVVVAPDLTSSRDAGRWPVFAQQGGGRRGPVGVRAAAGRPRGVRGHARPLP
ncbi:hypothetical protein QF032_004112 [Streptomyces achromogenes]|uniref:hypothetical protein n=1 Tax=Streptomyces achromogenes TaxID=67255 RepID=UPI00277F05EF|nr:hypothetical protein [Streptomyces achromogenes]MDQ0832268.1 hypothetical protein [Streptomyces achromogenes]